MEKDAAGCVTRATDYEPRHKPYLASRLPYIQSGSEGGGGDGAGGNRADRPPYPTDPRSKGQGC